MSEPSKLILASASPRRRELMERIGLPFVCERSYAEEILPKGMDIYGAAEYLSGLKASEVYSRHEGEDATVIGSDTVVILDGVIFGKPRDRDDARRMLTALSGRVHEVVTGVTIISGSGRESFSDRTEVTFWPLTGEEIERYIDTGEPMDKAGAYGAQGFGALLVKAICGDYYNVMGFPVSRVSRRLMGNKNA